MGSAFLHTLERAWRVTLRLLVPFLLFTGMCLAAFAIMRHPRTARSKISVTASPTRSAIDRKADHSQDAVFYSNIGTTTDKRNGSETNIAEQAYTVAWATALTQQEADELVEHLKSNGISGYVTPTQKGQDVLYHVRSGLFLTEGDAKKALENLAGKAADVGVAARVEKL